MVSRKRSAQARRQERDDLGQFKRASSTSSESTNGGDSDGSGDGAVVKKCGHKYCVSTSSDSGDSGVSKKGASAPRRRRAYYSSGSSAHKVGIELIDLTSASSDDDPVKQGMPSSSLRRHGSGPINQEVLKHKGKQKAMDEVPLHNIRSLQHELAESDARITMLVGQLEIEKTNRRATQRALLEANKKSSKKY